MYFLFALPVLRNCYTIATADTHLKVAEHTNSWSHGHNCGEWTNQQISRL